MLPSLRPAPATCSAPRRRAPRPPPGAAGVVAVISARGRRRRAAATGDSGSATPAATSSPVSDGAGSSAGGAAGQTHAAAALASSTQPQCIDGAAGHHMPAAAAPASSSSAQEQQRLLKQLLQLRSLDSLDDAALAPPPAAMPPPPPQPPSPQQQQELLYDDPAAAEYDVDPLLLDLRGFSSVGHFLQHELDAAAAQAKVAGLAVAVWAGLAALALSGPIGGPEAYDLLLDELTGGGASPGNVGLMWALLLGYFAAKGAVISFATGVRAWRARSAEEQHLQELAEQVEESGQRRAYWKLQERLSRLESSANRTYAGFALCSLLLGLLLITEGGLEEVQMRLDALDQGAAADMVVLLVLGTELYVAGIRGFVALVALATAFVNRLQHQRSQEQRDSGGE